MKTNYSITPGIALSAILVLGTIAGCGKKESQVEAVKKESERAGREAAISTGTDPVVRTMSAEATAEPAFSAAGRMYSHSVPQMTNSGAFEGSKKPVEAARSSTAVTTTIQPANAARATTTTTTSVPARP